MQAFEKLGTLKQCIPLIKYLHCKVIIIVLTIASPFCGITQTIIDQTLSMKQFIDYCKNTSEGRITFQNCEIDKYQGDSIFIHSWPDIHDKEASVIRHEFQNTTFQNSILISNCRINCDIYFRECDFKTIEFKDTKFNNITFDSCLFEGNLTFAATNGSHLRISQSILNMAFRVFRSSEINHIDVNQSRFDRTQYNDWKEIPFSRYYFWWVTNPTPLIINNSTVSLLHIDEAVFSIPFDTIHTVAINENSIDKLRISKSSIRSLSIRENYFNEYILFDSLNFKENIVIDGVTFPEQNSHISWTTLKGNKLAVNTENGLYKGLEKQDMENRTAYALLLGEYNKLFRLFKAKGLIDDANGCYQEMKDLETRWLAHQYDSNGKTDTWFRWQLNRFLKYFSDYGTNPAKSLVIAMRTILLFALFYFFFHSDWDRINRTFLIRQHRKLLNYFRSKQTMEDFYSNSYKEDLKPYQEYNRELSESKGDVPYFIHLLGRPLYRLSVIRHEILTWVYRRSEILHGKWSDLPKGRRFSTAFIVSMASVSYLLYLVSIRVINSIVLSINTFSTLGFGDIPVRGISRYVAILEGFLGWFLLSIFSVSLISQILQN